MSKFKLSIEPDQIEELAESYRLHDRQTRASEGGARIAAGDYDRPNLDPIFTH